MRTHDS
jgi:hypothetical protein